ncbi:MULTISPECIES: hypothetical protein [Euryhalocaulis]|uniref:hypothetical protein n=1 Tax=Euryhalocaulis TaxID=1712422 RepID=UPI0003A7C2E8|nr:MULTISPECIES: hypothetical protein [Euryhalocaulis]MBA4801595.1 hypothetical protein [Euryhalocaulis sp.]
MGQREIHYEVYLMRRRKGAWALYQAFDSRETAIETAKKLHAQHNEGAVRVEKETYDGGDRAFDAVTVFTLGEVEQSVHAGRDSRTAEPPCSLAEDLWTVHSRRTIARVLEEWLARETVLTLELMHRPDLAEKLESAGTTVQHAIQKTAIAQAQEYDSSVQHFVKRLNELSEKAFSRVVEDGRQGRLPKVSGAGEVAALAARLVKASSYRRCALIASGIKGAKGWAGKLTALLDIADQLTEPEVAEALYPDIDDFLTELLSVNAAADSLAQDPEDLGDILDALVDVITTKPAHPDNLTAGARRLSKYFAAKEFPGARAALARRVLDDLCRPVRLKPDDVWGEVKLSRALADRLIALAGADFPVERTAEAFIYRSGRMVAPEVIEEALATADTAVDALDRLMRLETAIAGAPTKRKLAAYIRGRLGSHQTEAEFVRGPGKPMERLAQLTALQRKAFNSGFCDEDRDEITDQLDRLGMGILETSKLIAALEKRDAPALEKAESLLRLATRNVLPQGRCQAEASARAQALLREAMKSGQSDPQRLTEIRDMLGEIAA